MPLGLSFTVKASGARHHARWMSKVIYSVKIELFRKQLEKVLPHDYLENITNLSVFLCLNYVESWTTSLRLLWMPQK